VLGYEITNVCGAVFGSENSHTKQRNSEHVGHIILCMFTQTHTSTHFSTYTNRPFLSVLLLQPVNLPHPASNGGIYFLNGVYMPLNSVFCINITWMFTGFRNVQSSQKWTATKWSLSQCCQLESQYSQKASLMHCLVTTASYDHCCSYKSSSGNVELSDKKIYKIPNKLNRFSQHAREQWSKRIRHMLAFVFTVHHNSVVSLSSCQDVLWGSVRHLWKPCSVAKWDSVRQSQKCRNLTDTCDFPCVQINWPRIRSSVVILMFYILKNYFNKSCSFPRRITIQNFRYRTHRRNLHLHLVRVTGDRKPKNHFEGMAWGGVIYKQQA